jgi:predicted phosphodiesterase
MRIALLSDIHGNSVALDAVLADIEAQGDVTSYWVLGDLVTLGPDPVGVLERLSRLNSLVCVRGNTDHYVVTDERPDPSPEEVRADLSLLPLYTVVAQQTGWTQGAVAAAGWMDWLAALPTEQRSVLPDGTRLLGVHASPGRHSGSGFHPNLSGEEMACLLAGCDADLVCVGHTHWPMNLHADGVHLVNLGSISNPLPPDLRACYVVLDADESGYRIEHRRVDYDRERVIAALERVRYPNGRFIVDILRGRHEPRWRSPIVPACREHPLP